MTFITDCINILHHFISIFTNLFDINDLMKECYLPFVIQNKGERITVCLFVLLINISIFYAIYK